MSKYDWKSYSTGPVIISKGSGPEIFSEWNHQMATSEAWMADQAGALFGDPPSALPRHVRGCAVCQLRWAKEIMRAHIEAVLMRVIER